MDRGDRDRYFQIGSVYLDIVIPLMRKRLQQNYENEKYVSLKDFLESRHVRHILFHLRNKNVKCCRDSEYCTNSIIRPLSMYQWNNLYELRKDERDKDSPQCYCIYTAKDIHLEELDISLAGVILFNCCELSQVEVTAIQSLRRLKNEYYTHNCNGSIKEEEFKVLWKKLKHYVLQLDNTKHNEFKIIKKKPLEQALTNVYQNGLKKIFDNVTKEIAKIEEFCPVFVSEKQRQKRKRTFTMMEDSSQTAIEMKTTIRQCNPNKRMKVSGMMSPGLSEENFQQLSYLLLRKAPQAVRQLFDKEFHPGVFQNVLRKSFPKLQTLYYMNIISPPQWRLLFPTTQEYGVSSNSLDTSTMCVLLRNLAALKITDRLPHHEDFSVESDLARINYYRKKIIYAQDTIINFKLAWADISGAITRLGNEHGHDELKSLSYAANEKVMNNSHNCSVSGLLGGISLANQQNDVKYKCYQKTEDKFSDMKLDSKLVIQDTKVFERVNNLDENIKKTLKEITSKMKRNNITKFKISEIQLDLDSTLQTVLQEIDSRNVRAKVIINELKKLHIKFELLSGKLDVASDTYFPINIENTVREGEEHYRKLNKDSGKIIFDPVQNKIKGSIEAICQTLFEEFNHQNREIIPEQSIDVDNIQLHKLTAFEIPKGEKEIHIRGCAILNKKEVCFADRGNNRLIFMTTKGYHKCFTLPCQPADITVLRGNKLAVALMEMNSVHIINTENMTWETISLNGHGGVSGLTCYKDSIVMRTKDGYSFVDCKGKFVKQIIIKGTKMPYVACAEDKIYFAKWEKNEVHCWNFSAKKLWVYKNESIISSPNGVCTDKDGNVYVTGSQSNNVVVISSDGTVCKEILIKQKFPIAIDLDKESKRLLVCSSNNNAVLYSLL